jgi:citrate synthase
MAKTVVHQDLKSYFGEEDHLTLAQSTKFSDLIFELLSERKPTESESIVFELILNLSIDHGPETPSTIKVIESAKEGKTISESVSSGVLEINDQHGGAIEPGMEFLYKIKNENLNVSEVVKDYLDNKKLIGGFGHRLYKELDPRSELIIKTLNDQGLGEEWIDLSKEVEQEIEKNKGIHLPLNIDGAIAVALCCFGWEARLGKAVFLSARVPGLCAHFLNNS